MEFFGFTLFGGLSGGALLGAFFVLAYEDSCPTTAIGKIISGVLAGVVTACIRLFGLFPDGSIHAILLMNILNLWAAETMKVKRMRLILHFRKLMSGLTTLKKNIRC